jgi:predicted small lipoprotein YifL
MPFPPPTFRLNLIVDDVVTAYLRAVRAGAIPVQRPSYSNDDPFLTYIQSSMTLSAAAGGSQQLSSAAKGVPSTTLAYSIGADKVNVADDDSAPPPTDSTHQQQLSFRITAIIRDPCGIEWVLIGAVAADSATPLPPVALGIGATTASATLSEGVAEATRDDDVGAGVETGADAGVTNRIDALQHAHTAQWRNIYWPMLFAALDAATAVGHCTPLAMPAASADAAVVAESTAQPATSAEKPKRKAAATGAATKKREEKASETAKKETQNATPRTPAPSAAEKLSPGVHAEARPSAVSSSSSAVAVAALKAMSQSKSAVVAGKRATPVPSKRLPEKEKIGAAIAVSTESPSASPAGGTVARAAAAAVQGSATPTPSTASAAAVVLLSTPTAAGIGDAANGVATPVPVLPSSVPKVPPKIAVRRSAPPSPAVPDLAKPFL